MSRHRFVPDQHEAITLRNDLVWLADAWADLFARLAVAQVTPDGQPRPASRSIGLVINERVSELMRDVSRFARTLVSIAAGSSGLRPVPNPSTPTLLRIAAHHVGSYTAHEEEAVRVGVPAQAASLRRSVERAAYPDGIRTIHLEGYRCLEHVVTAGEEFLPCPGHWTIRPLPSGSLADMICSADAEHRVPPYRWMRLVRRRTRVEDTADALSSLLAPSASREGQGGVSGPGAYSRRPMGRTGASARVGSGRRRSA